jgi:hypothetical protein
MTISLQMLENQLLNPDSENILINKEEEKTLKEKPGIEKHSSIPSMLKCFVCEGN